MKSKFLLTFTLLLITACSPSAETQTTLTATAKTAVAALWTPTLTATNTPSSTPTATSTQTATPSPSNTPTPTATQTPTYTSTLEPWPTPTLLATRATTETATIVTGLRAPALSLAWSPNQEFLFIGTKAGMAAYDVKNDLLGRSVGNDAQVQALAISPNGKLLAAGLANDGSLRIISTDTGMLEATIWPAHDDWPQAIIFGINNDWLVSGGDDGRLLLWDVSKGELLQTIYEGSPCLGLDLSPDGRTLVASFGYEEVIRVWDTHSWTLKNEFVGDQAQDLSISPDGQRIVTAGGGIHEANVWEISSGEQVFNLREHPGWVWAVAYSPQGHLIASAGIGESIYLWHAETGMPIRELHSGPDFIQTLAFSPDGKWLASGGEKVIIWDVSEY